jgi:hypothetical protein
MIGTRSGVALSALTALALLSPVPTVAQTAVFLDGAAAIPVGDFGGVANVGYQGRAGATVDLAGTGFVVGLAGFYGSHPHEISGDRSNLYGATVVGGYDIAEASGVRFTVWAGLGGMIHARRSDTFPGLDASKRGVAVSAGGTAGRPMGRISVFLSALYTRGLGDLGTAAYPTELVTFGAGVAVPLSLD